ncbi:MAG: DUF2441 domain-containing protein [Bacilli bacterium]|nr:DUF2441 domain-containing protein [Bacilli bacterium]
METEKIFYHFHRQGNHDVLWLLENSLDITKDFQSSFYENILLREKILKEKYDNYDIDKIIKALEMVMEKEVYSNYGYHRFSSVMNGYYILRRELALEEGRKIYNNFAPSRLHSVYLTDEASLFYWVQYVGICSRLFEVEVNGSIFESSDYLFPDIKAPFERQVMDSKSYWQPKELTVRMPKEYLFQGNIKIKGEKNL